MTAADLKEKRQAAKLTQQQLAERVGWEGPNIKQRIHDYESGRRQLTPAMQRLFTLIFSAT